MTSLLNMIAEALADDADHICVLPDAQSIYIELGPRRWSLTLREITEPVADIDTRIGPPRTRETP